jgi:hypothetical protein
MHRSDGRIPSRRSSWTRWNELLPERLPSLPAARRAANRRLRLVRIGWRWPDLTTAIWWMTQVCFFRPLFASPSRRRGGWVDIRGTPRQGGRISEHPFSPVCAVRVRAPGRRTCRTNTGGDCPPSGARDNLSAACSPEVTCSLRGSRCVGHFYATHHLAPGSRWIRPGGRQVSTAHLRPPFTPSCFHRRTSRGSMPGSSATIARGSAPSRGSACAYVFLARPDAGAIRNGGERRERLPTQPLLERRLRDTETRGFI